MNIKRMIRKFKNSISPIQRASAKLHKQFLREFTCDPRNPMQQKAFENFTARKEGKQVDDPAAS